MTNPKDALEWLERKAERERNMTEEQWLKSCNTEQFAEFIVDAIVFYDGNRHAFVTEALEMAKKKNVNLACDSIYENVVEWLKQPHTVKEQQDGNIFKVCRWDFRIHGLCHSTICDIPLSTICADTLIYHNETVERDFCDINEQVTSK